MKKEQIVERQGLGFDLFLSEPALKKLKDRRRKRFLHISFYWRKEY